MSTCPSCVLSFFLVEHKSCQDCNLTQSTKSLNANDVSPCKIKTPKLFVSQNIHKCHKSKIEIYRKKVAEQFNNQRMLRKYFFALNEYKSMEILYIRQIQVENESKRRYRLLRMVIRSWKSYVNQITKKEFIIVQNYKLRWLRTTFSKWLDFISHTRLRIQVGNNLTYKLTFIQCS